MEGTPDENNDSSNIADVAVSDENHGIDDNEEDYDDEDFIWEQDWEQYNDLYWDPYNDHEECMQLRFVLSCNEDSTVFVDLNKLRYFCRMGKDTASYRHTFLREFQDAIQNNTSTTTITFRYLFGRDKEEPCDIEKYLFQLQNVDFIQFQISGVDGEDKYIDVGWIHFILNGFGEQVTKVFFQKLGDGQLGFTESCFLQDKNEIAQQYTRVHFLGFNAAGNHCLDNLQSAVSMFPALENFHLDFKNGLSRFMKSDDFTRSFSPEMAKNTFESVLTNVFPNLVLLSLQGIPFRAHDELYETFVSCLKTCTQLQYLYLIDSLLPQNIENMAAALLQLKSVQTFAVDEFTLPIVQGSKLKEWLASLDDLILDYENKNMNWATLFLYKMIRTAAQWKRLCIKPSRQNGETVYTSESDNKSNLNLFYETLSAFLSFNNENNVMQCLELESLDLRELDTAVKPFIIGIAAARLKSIVLRDCQLTNIGIKYILASLNFFIELEILEISGCYLLQEKYEVSDNTSDESLGMSTCFYAVVAAVEQNHPTLKRLILYTTSVHQPCRPYKRDKVEELLNDQFSIRLCEALKNNLILEHLQLSKDSSWERNSLVVNPDHQITIYIFLKLNQAGRRYILDTHDNTVDTGKSSSAAQEDHSLSKTTTTTSSSFCNAPTNVLHFLEFINDDLDCLFLHLRFDNPDLCKQLLLGYW